MKGKHNGGFSLVESLVAIAILALITIPTCSGLVMSLRMNGKTDQLMQAQLAVSSAVETLMAEGIPAGTPVTPSGEDYGKTEENDRFPNVKIAVTPVDTYYNVTVTSELEGATDVSVTTSIRAVEVTP